MARECKKNRPSRIPAGILAGIAFILVVHFFLLVDGAFPVRSRLRARHGRDRVVPTGE